MRTVPLTELPDVAVYFIRPDGRHSKVYHYRGSYADILNRLGIRVITSSDMAIAEYQLRLAKETHGKPSLFSKVKPVDRSAEIDRLESLLERYKSDEFVRDWEWSQKSLLSGHHSPRKAAMAPGRPPQPSRKAFPYEG